VNGENEWLLARQAAGGDEAAFAVLIERYKVPVHSFVFRYVRDEETARDITQEVFVKSWFGLKTVVERARFSTWLFQIALNLCRDYAKSKSARNAHVTLSFAGQDSNAADMDVPSTELPPDKQAVTNEQLARLNQAIDALPCELRDAFLLGAVERVPYKDAAKILKISSKAVETRVYRARKALAASLGVRED